MRDLCQQPGAPPGPPWASTRGRLSADVGVWGRRRFLIMSREKLLPPKEPRQRQRFGLTTDLAEQLGQVPRSCVVGTASAMARTKRAAAFEDVGAGVGEPCRGEQRGVEVALLLVEGARRRHRVVQCRPQVGLAFA